MAGSFQLIDPAAEDLGQHVSVDNQLLDTVQMVGNRDRPENHRQMPGRVSVAALGRRIDLVAAQR